MNNLTFLLAMMFLVSCTDTQSANKSSNANEGLVREYFRRFNKHQWKEMAAMYTPTATFKDPSLGPGTVQQTQQQIIDKYTALANLFPDVQDEIVQLYPSGENNVIVEFVSTGTAPDKTKFRLPICTIFVIEEGKISKDFTYYDNFEEKNQ